LGKTQTGGKGGFMAALNKLTVRLIDGLPEGFHADGGNLYLRVRGNGKSWVFRYKIPKGANWGVAGKAVELGLGAYPARKLADAREVARDLRSEVVNGRDPAKFLKPDDGEASKTFKQYAEAYIAEVEGTWKNLKHRQQWRNTLKDYVYPHIGGKLPASITKNDIYSLLLPLWEAGKIETCMRVRMRIETVLNYAFHDLDIDRSNPARWQGNLKISFKNVSPRTKAKSVGKLKSHAAPDWREVPAIMAKLRDKPDVVSALALRFSILTATRSMEVRAGTWDEVDMENAVWHIPGDRTKNEEAHSVPLCEEALAILAAMAERNQPDTNRLFPGSRGGLLSDVAVNKVLHAAMPGITAHGIARSSFRDWVADATSFPDKVAEAALNHKNPNETEASYLRTKFFSRRVELMKAWGDFLKGKDNVVKLDAAANLA
jgi:integrase